MSTNSISNVDRFKTVRILFTSGKDLEAYTELMKHIKHHPKDAYAYLNLSYILMSLGKLSESTDAQNKALEIDPKCIETFVKQLSIASDIASAVTADERKQSLKIIDESVPRAKQDRRRKAQD